MTRSQHWRSQWHPAPKSYVLSPFADENQLQSIIAHVVAARRQVDAGSS
jgi:hypothetical protein